MKKIIYIIVILAAFLSCEDVVEIDTPAEEPRLIVDALIRLDLSKPTTRVAVKVSTTSSFFGEIQPTQLENIFLQLEDSGGFINLFELQPGSGIYVPSGDEINEDEVSTDFFLNERVLLYVRHEGQLYLAFAEFMPSVPIDELQQGDGSLFDDEETEVVVSFTDNPDRKDFYVFDFGFSEFLVTEDRFYNGQPFSFSYFYDNRLQSGQEITVSILGADRSFFNYMNQLIEQSNDELNPFSTPSNTVRGNFINVTEIDNIDFFDNVNQPNNFALGYFAISEVFTRTLIIE